VPAAAIATARRAAAAAVLRAATNRSLVPARFVCRDAAERAVAGFFLEDVKLPPRAFIPAPVCST
jgi:hypothetical protein